MNIPHFKFVPLFDVFERFFAVILVIKFNTAFAVHFTYIYYVKFRDHRHDAGRKKRLLELSLTM